MQDLHQAKQLPQQKAARDFSRTRSPLPLRTLRASNWLALVITALWPMAGHARLSLQRSLSTPWFRTHIPQNIPLPVQAGDEHGPPVFFATRLAIGNNGRLILDRGYVAQGLAETTVAELVSAAKKLN